MCIKKREFHLQDNVDMPTQRGNVEKVEAKLSLSNQKEEGQKASFYTSNTEL